VANSLGNGIVIPFLVIYLHDVRGVGLETAGAVIAVLLGIGVVGSPLAGRLVDRIGAKTTLMCSLGAGGRLRDTESRSRRLLRLRLRVRGMTALGGRPHLRECIRLR